MPAGKLTNDAPSYLSSHSHSHLSSLSPPLLLSYHDSVPTFSLRRRTTLVTIFISVSPFPFLLRSIPSSFTTPSGIRSNVTGLIAASFGTVVYNGFYCKPKLTLFYCTTNMLCGALGSYLPFQRWFNERRNKVSFLPFFQRCSRGLVERSDLIAKEESGRGLGIPFCALQTPDFVFIQHLRISFFLFLCFAMFAPMVHMFGQYGWHKASAFVGTFLLFPPLSPFLHLLSSLSPLLCYFTTCGVDD